MSSPAAARARRRIRHPLPPVRWPTREEAEGSLWFSRGTIGPLTTETRTWVPAMVPWRATEDGFVTKNVLDWYGRFADGAPGVLVVEATGIRDVPSGPLLNSHTGRPDRMAWFRRTNSRASGAPSSRSMPASSHSTEIGPS